MPRPGDPLPTPSISDLKPISRQHLLRRLARLDVVICRQDREPITVRSATGATATVRAGRWSQDEVRALLSDLDLSAAAFSDSR